MSRRSRWKRHPVPTLTAASRPSRAIRTTVFGWSFSRAATSVGVSRSSWPWPSKCGLSRSANRASTSSSSASSRAAPRSGRLIPPASLAHRSEPSLIGPSATSFVRARRRATRHEPAAVTTLRRQGKSAGPAWDPRRRERVCSPSPVVPGSRRADLKSGTRGAGRTATTGTARRMCEGGRDSRRFRLRAHLANQSQGYTSASSAIYPAVRGVLRGAARYESEFPLSASASVLASTLAPCLPGRPY